MRIIWICRIGLGANAKMTIKSRRVLLNVSAWTTALASALASSTVLAKTLDEMSIEELAQVQVTSVSKHAQPLGDAPAAIYVISSEDIHRSAATSLPEVLRLAPNLQIQQIDAHQYAISARGFNGFANSNKLLGLIDGRTMYTPLHAGIFWDQHQPMLDDLDRIEVISGPGGTLWGLNAVNGVINIISKSARDTQGGLVSGSASARERDGAIRYGGPLGSDGAFRIYANGYDREDMSVAAGTNRPDGFRGVQVGFRSDFGNDGDGFTVQGDYFYNDDVGVGRDTGHNILARWTHGFDGGSALQVQAYYDSVNRRYNSGRDGVDTIDLSLQHDIALGFHHIIWGAGVRTTSDYLFGRPGVLLFSPPQRRLWAGNIFVQDSYSLGAKVTLIGGVKFEKTTFTDIEALPNLRIAWKPAEKALLWAAVSRAVRTPSRLDRDLFHPILLEQGTFDSEELVAFETGYRGQPFAQATLSISLFYNDYDKLRTVGSRNGAMAPFRIDNGLRGHSYGIEAWGAWQALKWWRLSGGVSTLHKSFHLKPGHIDRTNGGSLGDDPDFQVMLRSQMTVADSIEIDLMLRGVDALPKPYLPGYVEADLRLGWHPDGRIELFVTGANLLHKLRAQSGEAARQLIPRTISAGARLAF
jgi:iron complex outermembrane receptor protein